MYVVVECNYFIILNRRYAERQFVNEKKNSP